MTAQLIDWLNSGARHPRAQSAAYGTSRAPIDDFEGSQ